VRSLVPLLVFMLLSPCLTGYAYEPCKYVVRINEILRGRSTTWRQVEEFKHRSP
jgi:hypothetical protein